MRAVEELEKIGFQGTPDLSYAWGRNSMGEVEF